MRMEEAEGLLGEEEVEEELEVEAAEGGGVEVILEVGEGNEDAGETFHLGHG